jgi:hydrogenase-4 component F
MDSLLFALLIVPPFAASGAALLAPHRVASWVHVTLTPLSLVAAVAIAGRLATGGGVVEAGSLGRIDGLSSLFAVLITLVATMAAWLGGWRQGMPSAPRAFLVYVNLFTATLLVAVSTANLGVMWVAIEASTVVSALLIPLGRVRAAVEASWRYLLIGSVGIALAFTGTVLAFVDFASTGLETEAALQWPALLASAHALHPEVARLAFVFLLVGFGTKAGLAPMHTWLPDAHAEAPARLSAMMSGVMLAVAMYAIARWKAIFDAALGYGFTDTLLLIVGVTTVAVGALSLVVQRDYKHVLAYSSIEHTGLACFGLALGPAGIVAALFHLTSHALAKSTAFLLAGRILDRVKTHRIDDAPGVVQLMPATGSLFAASTLALAGLPPFGLFLSEVLLVRAAWTAGHAVLTAAVLVLMLVAFAAIVHQLQRLLFGAPRTGMQGGEPLSPVLIAFAIPLGALAWLGLAPPASFWALLTQAAAVLHP